MAATPPVGTAGTGTLSGAWAAARRVVRGVLGADKYERYLAWHRTTGQCGEPMDVKTFWRHEMDRQESNPSSRCC